MFNLRLNVSVPTVVILLILPAFPSFAFDFETAASKEAEPLQIKGSKTISFSQRTLVGSKEGFIPGTTREETLKLNISGKVEEVEVDANILSTSTQTQQEEKMSITLRRGSAEVFFGDFIADFSDTEFATLKKALSGIRVKGDADKWSFKLVASTPQGEPKNKRLYGNNTQGPYSLGYASVVYDSEKVYVDGVLQVRGKDYRVDYQAGTVTFKDKVIKDLQVIEIDFEYRQAIYQHSTYGLRLVNRPKSGTKLGFTYLNDSDGLQNAASIRAGLSQPIDPISHYVVGVDGQHETGDLKIAGEFAFSGRDLDILSAGGEEAGKAAKINVRSKLGSLAWGVKGKRVGANFSSIGDPSPRQDVNEYGGEFSYQPNDLFLLSALGESQSYRKEGTRYGVKGVRGKTKIAPQDLPAFGYYFDQKEDSNDPVTGQGVTRTDIQNRGEITHRFSFWRTNLSGKRQRRIDQEPSYAATTYDSLNWGLGTEGLQKISASSNIELKETRGPATYEATTRTYNFNLSFTPMKEYFLSARANIIDDTQEGLSNVIDLGYKAEPNKMFKTDGKYTATYVEEDFAGTEEAVNKGLGSFKFDLRPNRNFRLRWNWRPNFTLAKKTGTLSYNNELSQSEVNWLPTKNISLGWVYKLNGIMSKDKSDPQLLRIQSQSDLRSTITSLKVAPIRILSCEFILTNEDQNSTQLASTEPTATYDDTTRARRKYEAKVKTSLSEKFSLDTSFAYERIDQDSDVSTSNIDSLSETASIKGRWDLTRVVAFTLGGAYTKSTDYLLTQETYTYSPSVGMIYRLGNALRVDAEYTLSYSYSGTATQKDKYSIKTRYNPNEYIRLSLRLEQETNSSPFYRASEVLGNVEIVI